VWAGDWSPFPDTRVVYRAGDGSRLLDVGVVYPRARGLTVKGVTEDGKAGNDKDSNFIHSRPNDPRRTERGCSPDDFGKLETRRSFSCRMEGAMDAGIFFTDEIQCADWEDVVGVFMEGDSEEARLC